MHTPPPSVSFCSVRCRSVALRLGDRSRSKSIEARFLGLFVRALGEIRTGHRRPWLNGTRTDRRRPLAAGPRRPCPFSHGPWSCRRRRDGVGSCVFGNRAYSNSLLQRHGHRLATTTMPNRHGAIHAKLTLRSTGGSLSHDRTATHASRDRLSSYPQPAP